MGEYGECFGTISGAHTWPGVVWYTSAHKRFIDFRLKIHRGHPMSWYSNPIFYLYTRVALRLVGGEERGMKHTNLI